MVKNKKLVSKKSESKKVKTRKDRTGLPQVDVISAITYTKKAYEAIGTSLKSFSGMARAMGISEAFGKKAFGELREYGVIEQENFGWKISDLGRRVAQNDKNAVIEVLVKNDILSDLFANLNNKIVDKDYIEDYIKKKRYRYNINSSLVADRFLEIMEYINTLEIIKTPTSREAEKELEIRSRDEEKWFKVIQLKYSLNPTKEISKLADEVAEEFENVNDVALKTLAKSIKDNKNNAEVLKVLVDNLIHIARKDYKNDILKSDKEAETESAKEKKQRTP